MTSNADVEVRALIDRWAKAELTGDVDAYTTLLAPDFKAIGPVGFVLDGEQWAGRHVGDLTNHRFDLDEVEVRVTGDTALVEAALRQQTTAMGNDTSGSFRVGLVARCTEDRWALARVQLSGPMIAPGERPAFARNATDQGPAR